MTPRRHLPSPASASRPRRLAWPALAALLLLGAAPAPLWSQAAAPSAATVSSGSLSGVVLDATDRRFLAGAEVALEGTSFVTSTDRSGAFRLSGVPSGRYTLIVRYPGLPPLQQSVDVAGATTLPLALALGDVARLDEVVVEAGATGQARALAQQRAAQNVVNLVAADALGRFPDAAIADSLRRLPGVTVEREAGNPEGRFVTLRGLFSDFNAVSIDGQRIMVSNFDGASRSVPLDVIATRSADSVEVTKTLTPDRDGDGIGGAIDIRTRSAFDREGGTASAEFALGWDALLEEYENYPYKNPLYRGSFSLADYLGDSRKWGFSVSGNFRSRPFAIQSVNIGGYWDKDRIDPRDVGRANPFFPDRVLNPLTNQPAFIPTSLRLEEFFDDVTGIGATATVEYRPSDDYRVRLAANHNVRDTDRGRQRQVIEYRFGTSRIDTTQPIAVQGDTFTRFTTTASSRIERQVRDFEEAQSNSGLVLDGEGRHGDLGFKYAFGYTRGEFDGSGTDTIASFRSARTSRNSYDLSPGPEQPAFTTSLNRNDPSQFSFFSLDRGTAEVIDDEFSAALDLKLDGSLAGFPGFLQFGLKGRLRARDYDLLDRFFASADLSRSVDWRLDRVLVNGSQVYGSQVADYRSTSTADGNYNYGFFVDPKKIREVESILASQGLLTVSPDARERTLVGSYEAEENVYATYVMGQVRTGRLTTLAGARLEFTDVEFETAQGEISGGLMRNVRPIRGENDYTDVLPHLHLRYDATENLVLRASYHASIARPSYRQLNPTETLNFAPDDLEIPTVTRGNTRLDPIRSHNVDVGAEYYFDSIGQVSVGFFAKEMENNVYRLAQLTTISDGRGGSEVAELREFLNAEGASVIGVEFGFERRLPAPLDGLSFFANYTYVDSEVDGLRNNPNPAVPQRSNIETPLFAQVEDSANVGLTYERGGLFARVAWNYRGPYLYFDGVNLNPALDRYLDESQSFDVSASYRLNRHWEVFAEWNNVTGEPDSAYRGNADLRPDYTDYRDWSGWVGVRWTR